MTESSVRARDEIPVLPDSIPVVMPDLPVRRIISTEQQLKAISEQVRSRILTIIQNQPATAKQIADRLDATPGAIGHHLRILEAAGLAQVVARRLTRGIVANYYTRTARIFVYDLPPGIGGAETVDLDIMTTARNEMAEALVSIPKEQDPFHQKAFPHVRLSPERAKIYYERLEALVDDVLSEPYDPDGEVYGILVAMFKSPRYAQGRSEQE